MRLPPTLWTVAVGALLAGIATGFAIAQRNSWSSLTSPSATASAGHGDQEHGDDHAGHDHAGHDHSGHDHGDEESGETQGVPLSEQARINLGLKLGEVALSNYTKTLVVPGVVVEQPGHSERRITTSLAGVVAKIHAFPGQAVRPGDPLMDIQPTGELLTSAQAQLLTSLQDLQLVDLELKRLAPLVENGSVPARNKLEKEYERQRLEAQKLVQIQELLVRGLTPYQITEIVEHKTLLREFTIYVPGGTPHPPADDGHNHPSIVPAGMNQPEAPTDPESKDIVYTVEAIDIFPGKLVQPGEELCDLALHTELYLEGHAFERDSPMVSDAVREQRPITAVFESEAGAPEIREGLKVRYVENSLDPATRTLRFFVPIKNEVINDAQADNGVVYRSWRFKPGQRVRLLIPLHTLADQIVLPAEAVITEGPDAYVFRANGKLLERVPVILEQRDPRSAVIRNDGTLFPGDEVALNQAYQINLALKKRQGSGVDMHAGHNH